VSEALRAQRDDSLARRSPTEICDHLLRAAGRGPGPVGVDGWQDDRTVFVFAVETGAKRG
jgi:hypothetical protein